MVLRVFLVGSKEEVVDAVAVFSAELVGYWLVVVVVVASVVVLVGAVVEQ